MTRKEALTDLLGHLKEGHWTAAGDGTDTWIRIFDAGLRPQYADIYDVFERNSSNAAERVHDMLLPGWARSVGKGGTYHPEETPIIWAQIYGPGAGQRYESCDEASTTARALLIADLKALIAMEDT